MRATEGMANDRATLNSADRTKVAEALDARIVADLGGTRVLDEGDARSPQPDKLRPRWGRRLVIGLVVAAVLWAGFSKGVPYVRELIETVETDDAFVAGHITYVSPRIEDVVTEVLVDQEDRVEPGQLLVRLDRQPFELAVAQNIANVALPYISGGMAVGRSQATWVLTSYLVANAIVLPLSGWLMGLVGRKRFYMTCVFLFTVSSALCGAAPNIGLLILFRVLQGLGGGGLQPSEQGILVATFPAQQRGMAMAIYGVAVVVAPILGPVLGGYLSDNYSWRWIFYINVPIGIVSLLLTSVIVRDPPGMAEEVRANWRRGLKVDYIGLALVSLGLGSLEVLYAKGQEWGWFGEPFGRVQTFFTMTVIGLVAFAIWELRHPNPMINLRLLGERDFLACGLIIYVAFAALYGANVVTPQMLQELFGYDAFHAGLVLSPPAFFTMAIIPVVGFLLGKKVDARSIIPLGLLCVAGASYWQAHLNLDASPFSLIAPRCVQMLGAGMLFVPLNNATYLYLSQHQVNNAAGLFNMLRNEGGSLGIAIVDVLVDRRGQFHHLRLAEHVTPLNPPVDRWIDDFAQTRMIRGGVTRAVAEQQGMGLLSRMVHNQAREMAYLDPFWVFAVMALAALPLILLMKKAVAKGGVAMH